ncbi:hypothetical protein ACIA8G_04945 [Lentzea sp. NPDC051213]|uniref:hypothetical protein n=1 Tax=Lentzea sp. NPDC051213 TaxID=3364126 RepID=UPI0037B56A09
MASDNPSQRCILSVGCSESGLVLALAGEPSRRGTPNLWPWPRLPKACPHNYDGVPFGLHALPVRW